MANNILLYIPNLMGYCRLVFAIIAWSKWNEPTIFLSFFILSCFLDFLDGFAARYLKQTSAFGAWLDVALDNFTRSMIWCRLYPSFGFFIASLEWLTFVCTHQLGDNWKKSTKQQPKFVSLVMADNFNSPIGLWAILSVWLLPVGLYCYKFSLISTLPAAFGAVILVLGRLIAFLVEIWFIYQHIDRLLQENSTPNLN